MGIHHSKFGVTVQEVCHAAVKKSAHMARRQGVEDFRVEADSLFCSLVAERYIPAKHYMTKVVARRDDRRVISRCHFEHEHSKTTVEERKMWAISLSNEDGGYREESFVPLVLSHRHDDED